MGQKSKQVSFDKYGVNIGGKYETLLCASLFYFRVPRSHWKRRIEALKNVGYNCVDTYFPWNYHERPDGSFDFTGERDVGYFLSLLRDAGMYVYVRPGPYICSEWSGGAIPSRILESDMPIRCTDERFMAEVKRWYGAVLKEIVPYEFCNGGTVITVQLDNEIDFFDCPDPDGYVSALRDIARECGVTVPVSCCAGQYGVKLAGCTAKGVETTLNCYPYWLDTTFDKELRNITFHFGEKNKPFLISETHRDHFMIRREFSCGAKFVSAYNQVAGADFDFNQAINNWGEPITFLSSEYDFCSMIDAAGNYMEEAREFVTFSNMLKTLGERISKAIPSKNTVVPDRSDFETTADGFSVLDLDGGGTALCVPNFGDESGEIEFTYQGHKLKATVKPKDAPYFVFGVDLKANGINAKLVYCNAELVRARDNKLVFWAENEPDVGLDFGGGVERITGDCNVHGVEIKFLDHDAVIKYLGDGNEVVTHKYKTVCAPEVSEASDAPKPRTVKGKDGSFGALGSYHGEAIYEVTIPEGQKLYIEHPCDMMSYSFDGKPSDVSLADGRDVMIPASKSGKYTVKTIKWGHCNFDDAQAPALRLKCKKGATSFGAVKSETEIKRATMLMLDEYLTPTVDYKSAYPLNVTFNWWNVTRKPFIAGYTVNVTRDTDRLILKVAENVDVAAYIDGKLVCAAEYGKIDLTAATKRGKEHALTVVYRKRIYTENCGGATLIGINDVEFTAKVLSEKELCFTAKPEKKLKLPLKLEIGAAKAICIDLTCVKKEGKFVFEGKNVLLTCVSKGRTVGRIVLDWENGPKFVGGDQNKLYVSETYGDSLAVYMEALGNGATLKSVEYIA